MMQRMIRRRSTRTILTALAGAVLVASPLACGSNPSPPGAAAPGKAVDCGGQARSAADCSGAAAVSIDKEELRAGAASSKQEETAIQRIRDQLDKLAEEQAALCRSYNACAIDEATYRASSEAVKARVDNLPSLLGAMKSAKTDGQRKRALDDLYRGVVPEEQRVEELTFRMGMRAVLPKSAGGRTIDVEPGAPVPTNAQVSFAFEVSKDAHLYIFQKSPKDEVSVLFPDPRIGTQNPLRGGGSAEIPPNGQHFRLNDKDLGIENVYIVVSRAPIQSLDDALQKVKEGKVTTIAQDSTLRAFTAVVPGTPPSGCKTRALELEVGAADRPTCTRSRGLVLDAPPASGGADAGGVAGSRISFSGRAVMEVRTDPGDDMIVKVFPFNHVTEQRYPEEVKALQAPAQGGSKAVKTRSVVIEI